jgi:uncharacterized membrane protein YfcA
MMTWLLLYLALGAVAGVLAGLLGVGGGLVIVPMLLFTFDRQGMPPEQVMHLALGTSMASIIFTSISSFMAHHRRGAVKWTIVRRMTSGIVAGTVLGSLVVSGLSTHLLKIFFALFVFIVSVQLLLDRKPRPSRGLPGLLGLSGAGGLIGFISSLVGIGGGTLSVPFMIGCNVPVHAAIGTSAALGFPIAISGALAYIINGWSAADLPSGTLGYVYLPALVCIVAASMLTAPQGARLAHYLPVPKLKRAFACLLLIVAARMLWGVWGSR